MDATSPRTRLVIAAAGGSALLLAGAYLFQAMGYAPCHLCLLQRWPHFAAVVLGVLALAVRGPLFPIAGASAASAAAILGIYHTGVERAWWLGPTSCGGTGGLGGDLLSLDGPRLVLCNQVSWEFLGLSMASWNALASLVLVGVWVMAARASTPARLAARA